MRPTILSNAYHRPRVTREPTGVKLIADGKVYACYEELVDTIYDVLKASPVLLPTVHDREAAAALLDHVDGIMLQGSVSNIEPELYGEKPIAKPQIFDPDHDATDLFLVRCARAKRIPFLGICRSMQAMNVAFGGSLKQDISKAVAINHKCSIPCHGTDAAPEYMHGVALEAGGFLESIWGAAPLSINSMHEQAVDTLGVGLRIEARAPDGTIEAISCPGAGTFFVGLQWHPETLPEHPVSQKIFAAFREAIEVRFRMRTG